MKKILMLTICMLITQASILFASAFDIHQPGTLRVITGPMRADKTGALIRYAQWLEIAKENFLVAKPDKDDRKSSALTEGQDPKNFLSSQGIGTKSIYPCTPVTSVAALRTLIKRKKPSQFLLDETNFFEEKQELVDLIRELLKNGTQVIVAGLNLNCFEETFEPMGDILALADYVEKLTAICDICKSSKASRTQRLRNGLPSQRGEPEVVVEGSSDAFVYQTRCLKCYQGPE